MIKAVLASAALVLPAAALAQEETVQTTLEDPKKGIQMGDLYNNAFTTNTGTIIVHPFLPSSFAVSDNLEVKTSLLGLLGGPNVAAEYAVIQTPQMAFSLEPAVGANWGFNTFSTGLTARYSMALGTNYLNVNGGAIYARAPTAIDPNTGAPTAFGNIVTVPVSVSYSLVSSPQTIWDISASTNVTSFLPGSYPFGVVGFSWNHAFGNGFQLGLGLNVFGGPIPQEIRNLFQIVGVNLPPVFILPLPDVTLTWKF